MRNSIKEYYDLSVEPPIEIGDYDEGSIETYGMLAAVAIAGHRVDLEAIVEMGAEIDEKLEEFHSGWGTSDSLAEALSSITSSSDTEYTFSLRKHYHRIDGLLDRIEIDKNTYGQEAELLNGLLAVHKKLDLPNEYIDSERGEHYSYSMSDLQIKALKDLGVTYDFDFPDTIALSREERPWGGVQDYGDDEFYTNPWGDIVFNLKLGADDIIRNYKLTVFAESGAPWADLAKYTQFIKQGESESRHPLASIASDMIGFSNPEESKTAINHIDGMEYASLVDLLRNIDKILNLET